MVKVKELEPVPMDHLYKQSLELLYYFHMNK